MISIAEPYSKRSIRFLEYWNLDDWKMKVYGIAYEGNAPDAGLIEAAKVVTKARLEKSGPECNHYRLGFVGVHQGKTGNFVFVDWWADENELHHHVYISPSGSPAQLDYMTPTGLSACVWDLRVICFEREAWLEAILKQYDAPDHAAYLANVLNADV